MTLSRLGGLHTGRLRLYLDKADEEMQDKWFMGLGWWTREQCGNLFARDQRHNRKEFPHVCASLSCPLLNSIAKSLILFGTELLSLMGDLPRLELFARQAPAGWDVWGNEVLSDIWIE